MKLASISFDGREFPAVVEKDNIIPVSKYSKVEDGGLDYIIKTLATFKKWYIKNKDQLKHLPKKITKFLPPLKNPGKIWGIGLNYQDHASDLDEISPNLYPASFMKPRSTIIGQGDVIKIPRLSERTTGEAELGIIIGKQARDVDLDNWLDYVAGFTPIIDMTAEDILRKNPRYLTLSKSFDTFFSFGSHIITKDEFTTKKILDLTVSTIHNESVIATNKVSNMTFTPDKLVSFHSKVMSLESGDIISTGTPGAAILNHGDTIECRIKWFEPLINPVIDLKTAT